MIVYQNDDSMINDFQTKKASAKKTTVVKQGTFVSVSSGKHS